MMETLTLNSKKSLFPDISVTIDGEKYFCRKLTRPVMRKYYQWEAELTKSSEDGDALQLDQLVFDHLIYLFPDMPAGALDEMESDEIHALANKLGTIISRRKIEGTAALLGEKKPDPEKKKPDLKTPSKKSTGKGSGGSRKTSPASR